MARSHANLSCIQLGCSLLTFKHNKNFLCASQPWLLYISWGILKSFLGNCWVRASAQPSRTGKGSQDRTWKLSNKEALMDEKRRLIFHEKTIAFWCFVWKNAKLEIITGRKRLLVQHFADVWTLLSKDEQSNSPWLTMPKGAANWLRWNFLNKIHFGSMIFTIQNPHGFHRGQTQAYIL